ncbi:MAG: SDR family NAD(P)-dependent oxidoreductase, partial [Gammaproteobacteria bacterium]|nr:SDR family NAD(P)-dependent oxidoreductase [Gammaproteobacteria bacterium]
EDALGLVLLRGQLMDEVPEGGMLAVPMPAEELTPWLCGKLDLAAANSPQLSVASGPADLLDDLTARLAEEGIEAQRVRINIAAHSRLLDGILERFRAYLKSIRLQEPNLPLISNRTGKWLEPHRARDPEYWVEHLRNTVLFGEGVNTLLDTDKRIFIEVGPGVTLGSLVRQNPAAPAQRVFGSLRHPEDPASDEVFFRTVTGRLWAVGVDIDHSRLWTCPRVRAPLPTYAFQHNEYWIPPGAGAASADAREAVRPQRLAALTDWFRVPRWVQQGIVDEDPQPRTWLIFHGNDPVADALIQHVREGKHTVVTVGAGDTFSRAGEYAFTIAPEAAGVGYQELVEALREDNLLPERILHTWLLTGDRSFRPGSTFFHRNQEYGFYSLLHLAQALGRAGLDDHDIHFVVAANGVIRIGDESAPCPDKATALGPCAVIPREFPRFTCRFVDVELPAAETARARRKAAYPCPKPVLDALGAEVEAAAGSEVVAWRDGVRWRRHLGPWRQPPAREGSPRRLRRNGVYLITGGLGGIAGVLADWLAREFDARLVLVGRTPLPNRDDWDDWLARHRAEDSISRGILRVRELESLGATVLPMTADVTVAERMREVVREAVEQAGPINGVFHTAGVIRDNLIQLKSQRDIEEVFSAKVYGTMVLDEMFRDRQLDFMVLFSSTSLYVAPEGQVDYVGANAFLNAFADAHLARRPYPVTAINWGIWKDVGMMGKTPEASVGAVAATADPDLSHATPMPARHPLFQEHYAIREGVTEVHFFNGTLDASSHWVVNEHRLSNGAALLPGTGYLELIHAGLQEAGIDGPWQLTGLSFLHPLFVADNNARAFRVRLRGHERYWEVEIVAARRNGDRPDWETCATARIARDAPITPARIDLAAIQARCDQSHEAAGGSSALRTRQEDHIRFGPRWRVLKRLDLGTEEALARLQLPGPLSNDLDDYVLHPALLDIATGCAMDLVPGYTKQDTVQKLWAPISYRAVRFHARLQAEIASWIRRCDSRVADGFVAFDVTITDVQGQPLVEVEQLTLRRIDGALEMPRSTQPGETAPRGDTEPAEKPPKQAASPGEIALQHNVSQGIDVEQGIRALSRLLDAETMPASLVVSSMDIGALLRQAEAIGQAARSSSDARFTRPELDNEFEAPRDELEENLAELWGKLLGVEGVGIRDSFFDLGGHSLIAVRLFNEISDRYEVDLPMSVLMQSPTIADLAELIRDEAPDLAEAGPNEQNEGPTRTGKRLPEFRHIVPMHIGPIAADTPLFMVSGMFGNVLNLSHMAHLLGEERPFYALQARGLYGDAMPHETFEEMATDYIAEIRKVQPHGPYLIGGFSGGGIAAYEIARQLLAKGEQVSQVILLDTPLPEIATFSFGDKVSMFMQGLHAEGLPFIAKKIRIRIEWEKQKRAKKRSSGETEQRDALHFQSQRIGDAFVRAITRYEMPTVPVDVALFRPRLDVRFRLKGGRLVDGDRNYVAEDNGWTPYVKSLRVFEVPGDHDGMVLEPNVRVLVAALRRSIDDAEARIQVQAGNDQAPTIAASR